MARQNHEFGPFYEASSRILILGSFPSVKSRETGFYYGHPQNRFWKVVCAVTGETLPETMEEKKEMLRRERIALWDVIESCEITGSKDSSIRDVIPNDIAGLAEQTQISRIFANGGTAADLYRRYAQNATGMPAVRLPSTSPANASWTLPRLIEAWSVILVS